MSVETICGVKLSPQQRRLWLLQFDHGQPLIAQCTVSLAGVVQIEKLRRALKQLVQRHEILRTTFQQLPGMIVPLQVVNDTGVFPLDEYDLSEYDFAKQESEIAALLDHARRMQWDFEHGPLIHASLLKLGTDKHLLILSVTCLYTDATGLGKLVEEIARSYGETLGEVPLQYADVSGVFNDLLNAEDAEAGRDYWARQDWTGLRELRLPYEKKAGAQTSQRATITINVPALENIEARVFLLACWQILLWRLSGQTNVLVGAVTSGRSYEEVETSPGAFDRVLPIKCELAEDLRFRDVLQQVSDRTDEVSAWQESFTWDHMDAHESSTMSFFPFCFDYESVSDIPVSDGLKFSICRKFHYAERFKIMLSCSVDQIGLQATLHYDVGMYEPGDMTRLAAEFETLVRSALQQPEARLGALEIVGPQERAQQLVSWNQTARAYPSECVHELFARQAAETPARIAVVSEAERLTYGELNERANRLARHLQGLGVGAEVRVGLWLERSVELLVGVLGILKAGGAYVPLDPQYPRERVRYMLGDSGAAVLVTEQRLLAGLPEHEAQVVLLDSERELLAQPSGANPESRVTGENLAYVIYTSGSTGAPKGVGVEHRQLSNYVHAILEALALKAPASFATVSTLAADLGNTAIYPSLCSGGTLHIISAARAGDTALLGQYFNQHQVDILKIVPSHLAALMSGAGAEQVLPRQCLILGGESTHPELVRKVCALRPTCQVMNHYGPTETTVGALTYKLPRPPAIDEIGDTLPLGRPLANAKVFLLDHHLRPVPAGAIGEVYIGGAGVSRGYLERPDLTAEKFVPDPFGETDGARLYRTGDRARYLPDGKVEFLGRTDKQVKLRGYRIELGEIEASLRAHETVRDAIALIDTGILLAYVAPERKFLEVIEGRRRHSLPNGMAVVQQNKNETEYQYREIFSQESYLQHGVTLHRDMCVFDVGANIGMFTLFVAERCPGARIYAFEPIAEVCQSLRINAELYGTDVKVFDYGLADEEREEFFTVYPRQSMMSGSSRHADRAYEKEVIKRSMRYEQPESAGGMELLLAQADELLDKRFEERTEQCRLRNLSTVMRAESIDRIDLLKVDVQGAEMEVLCGIDEDDWTRIGQIVLEVHDRKETASAGRLEIVRDLLERHEFALTVTQSASLEGTDRYNVYAVREGWWPASSAACNGDYRGRTKRDAIITSTDLRSYLREKLPEYMVPNRVILLDEIPLTPNGKVDTHALRKLRGDANAREKVGEELTPTEEIVAGIWSEILKTEVLDVDASFFDLGGHSLLATQVMLQIREAFDIELHLISLFESPTVRGLAAEVDLAIKRSQAIKSAAARENCADITIATFVRTTTVVVFTSTRAHELLLSLSDELTPEWTTQCERLATSACGDHSPSRSAAHKFPCKRWRTVTGDCGGSEV